MAGTNVGRVMALYGKLDHRPMRLLVHMAWRSLDVGQVRKPIDLPCLYWDSTAAQCIAVWGSGWTPARDRTLRRLRSELVRTGAIDRVGTYRQRPVFRIHTGEEPSLTAVDNWLTIRRSMGGMSAMPESS